MFQGRGKVCQGGIYMIERKGTLRIMGKDRAIIGCSGSEIIRELERYRDLQGDGIFMQE